MKKTNYIIVNHAEKTLILTGEDLTLEGINAVCEHEYTVQLSESSKFKIEKNRAFLEEKISSGETIYGLNTGFGFLSNKTIEPNKLSELQVNLIRSHSVGVGDPLTPKEVIAAMLLRANSLTKGFSGVRVSLIEKIIELINKRVTPVVPKKGSVGASGDLAPLSHMALLLIGEGEAIYNNKKYHGREALIKSNTEPIEIKAKEGLALINGTPVTTAITALNLIKAKSLTETADLAGAMTLEACKGSHRPFIKEIQNVRPHPGQIKTAKNIRGLLTGSQIERSHKHCDKVQDAYSLRCIPQVHGAVRDVLTYAEQVITIELNSSNDNPLIFDETNKIVSGGNFHAEPIAFIADFIGIAISEIASISERRIDKLMNPEFSGLPPFLAKDSGLNSGLMMSQVTAAALVSENKILASPASVDSIPTSADKEDHVSMGTTAAVKLTSIIENTRDVLSIELLCAFQGLHFHLPLLPSKAVKRAYDTINNVVRPIDQDRPFYEDMKEIKELIETNELLKNIRVRT